MRAHLAAAQRQLAPALAFIASADEMHETAARSAGDHSVFRRRPGDGKRIFLGYAAQAGALRNVPLQVARGVEDQARQQLPGDVLAVYAAVPRALVKHVAGELLGQTLGGFKVECHGVALSLMSLARSRRARRRNSINSPSSCRLYGCQPEAFGPKNPM